MECSICGEPAVCYFPPKTEEDKQDNPDCYCDEHAVCGIQGCKQYIKNMMLWNANHYTTDGTKSPLIIGTPVCQIHSSYDAVHGKDKQANWWIEPFTIIAREMYTFIKDTENEHLTLLDFKHMAIGDELDVICWHRNWEEYCSPCAWDRPNCQPIDAEEFYKGNGMKVIYKGGTTWDIKFEYGETIEHPIHLSLKPYVEETYWKWAPIDEKDGKIHITDEYLPRGQEKIPDTWQSKHIHWSEFPLDTRIGWRGPMMLREKLAGKPKLYHKDGYYGK